MSKSDKPPAQQPKEPNPDMNYSALERLDIKFTELIGAIEEKQIDGMLSNKDHGDYELVCYCRGFIRAELEKERRSRPHPAPMANQGPDEKELYWYERGLRDGAEKARAAREDILADKMLIIEEFHKILVHAHIDCATFLTGESVVKEIREVTKQSLRGEREVHK